MSKNYQQLKNDLEELENAFDNENNPSTQVDIQRHIAEVKQLLSEYNLSDDDLFQCSACGAVFDIEDSISQNDTLVCISCSERH